MEGGGFPGGSALSHLGCVLDSRNEIIAEANSGNWGIRGAPVGEAHAFFGWRRSRRVDCCGSEFRIQRRRRIPITGLRHHKYRSSAQAQVRAAAAAPNGWTRTHNSKHSNAPHRTQQCQRPFSASTRRSTTMRRRTMRNCPLQRAIYSISLKCPILMIGGR